MNVRTIRKSTTVTTFTMRVHYFDLEASIGTCNSSQEGAMKLKLAPFCSSRDALSDKNHLLYVISYVHRLRSAPYR